VSRTTFRRQRGITVFGFLILAVLFGTVGLGAIKVAPMYIKNMRLSQILQDTEKEFSGKTPNPGAIRNELYKRFSIEDINLPAENVKIAQSKNGYTVQIQYENRVSYIADVWLLVIFDKQVEIRR
jgi:hypothetical protein